MIDFGLISNLFLIELFYLNLLGFGVIGLLLALYFYYNYQKELQKSEKLALNLAEETKKNNQLNKNYQNLSDELKETKERLNVQNATIEKQNHALQTHGKRLLNANVDLSTYLEEIETQRKIIERQTRDTIDSILYAQHIQSAMLPKIDQIKKVLPQSFVFFRPRDIVSGDFYWFNSKSHRAIISAVDCTGHGVPGAFLSMIGNELLNKIVIFKGISEPDKILNQLNLEVRHTLKQKETENEDGMDIGLVAIHQVPPEMEELFGKPRLEFAGARSSLIYIQHNELFEIKGDKVPIGGFLYEEDHIFTKHIVDLSTPTIFYVFSDGYQDQFGGKDKRKFMVPRFRKLLFEIHHKPMDEQQKIIEETLMDWMGDGRQMDDILIIGVKIENNHIEQITV
jgi:serine phosphatase RsbU (regulator of sigma subunit)